jgi:hypothetical protein
VRLLTQDEGTHGPISGPIEALRPVWEELTGAKLELGLVPVSELYATMALALARGGDRYDAAVVAAYFYGDLVAGKYLASIDPLMASVKFPRWSYDSMPPALRQLYGWTGVDYGVLNDADGQIFYYRRDVLNDPANQAAFNLANAGGAWIGGLALAATDRGAAARAGPARPHPGGQGVRPAADRAGRRGVVPAAGLPVRRSDPVGTEGRAEARQGVGTLARRITNSLSSRKPRRGCPGPR